MGKPGNKKHNFRFFPAHYHDTNIQNKNFHLIHLLLRVTLFKKTYQRPRHSAYITGVTAQRPLSNHCELPTTKLPSFKKEGPNGLSFLIPLIFPGNSTHTSATHLIHAPYRTNPS